MKTQMSGFFPTFDRVAPTHANESNSHVDFNNSPVGDPVSAQRTTLLMQQRLETPEKQQPRQALPLREFSNSLDAPGRNAPIAFNNHTANLERNQLMNAVGNGFASNSENAILPLSNHSDTSLLRV